MTTYIRYRLQRSLTYYFPLFLCTGLIIYALQTWKISLPDWINSYANDFLCMPIVLNICRNVVRFLRSNSELLLPLQPIVILTLGYALYFEYYLPTVNARYTKDVLDVLLYGTGSGFFYGMQYITQQKRL